MCSESDLLQPVNDSQQSTCGVRYRVGMNAPSLITSPRICTLEHSVTAVLSVALVIAAVGTVGIGCRLGAPACQQPLSVCRVVITLAVPQGSGFSSALETLLVWLCACLPLTRLSSSFELLPPGSILPPQRFNKPIQTIWLIVGLYYLQS